MSFMNTFNTNIINFENILSSYESLKPVKSKLEKTVGIKLKNKVSTSYRKSLYNYDYILNRRNNYGSGLLLGKGRKRVYGISGFKYDLVNKKTDFFGFGNVTNSKCVTYIYKHDKFFDALWYNLDEKYFYLKQQNKLLIVDNMISEADATVNPIKISHMEEFYKWLRLRKTYPFRVRVAKDLVKFGYREKGFMYHIGKKKKYFPFLLSSYSIVGFRMPASVREQFKSVLREVLVFLKLSKSKKLNTMSVLKQDILQFLVDDRKRGYFVEKGYSSSLLTTKLFLKRLKVYLKKINTLSANFLSILTGTGRKLLATLAALSKMKKLNKLKESYLERTILIADRKVSNKGENVLGLKKTSDKSTFLNLLPKDSYTPRNDFRATFYPRVRGINKELRILESISRNFFSYTESSFFVNELFAFTKMLAKFIIKKLRINLSFYKYLILSGKLFLDKSIKSLIIYNSLSKKGIMGKINKKFPKTFRWKDFVGCYLNFIERYRIIRFKFPNSFLAKLEKPKVAVINVCTNHRLISDGIIRIFRGSCIEKRLLTADQISDGIFLGRYSKRVSFVVAGHIALLRSVKEYETIKPGNFYFVSKYTVNHFYFSENFLYGYKLYKTFNVLQSFKHRDKSSFVLDCLFLPQLNYNLLVSNNLKKFLPTYIDGRIRRRERSDVQGNFLPGVRYLPKLKRY